MNGFNYVFYSVPLCRNHKPPPHTRVRAMTVFSVFGCLITQQKDNNNNLTEQSWCPFLSFSLSQRLVFTCAANKTNSSTPLFTPLQVSLSAHSLSDERDQSTPFLLPICVRSLCFLFPVPGFVQFVLLDLRSWI